ncbi:diguanylate cyclase [Bacillus salitolerans]|uniref:Diguanylate cyclase n=1 Tax=Bacillus salitolerans TaxID=1437434 RepID=A0ABW4LNF5_9BACI
MGVSVKRQIMIYLAWLLLFPTLLWMIYINFQPPVPFFETDMITFLLLMCIVSALPIIVNDTPIFFTNGVSLSVFLVFGLFAEVVFMQIALIVLMVKVRVSNKDFFRVPMNSLMFLFISLSGAFVYYGLGGKHGEFELNSTNTYIPIITYVLTVVLFNHVTLHLVRKFIYKRSVIFFSRDLIWEVMTTLFTIPVGFVLYVLYSEIGITGVFYVGLPFVSLAIILKLYYSSQKVNTYLQDVSSIGHQLTERLEVNEVLTLFIAKLSDMLKVDVAYIVDVSNNNRFELLRYMENGKEVEISDATFHQDTGISRYVYEQKQPVLFKKRSEWSFLASGFLPSSVESVISVPVKRHQQVVGIITLASTQKRAYERFQLMIVDILANYLAVAIENAKHHEATKNISERCALTSLYNYRYFENKLEEEFKVISENPSATISLVLLDLDHFKSVNDTYGHQAGNEILSQLAERLVEIVGAKGTVARYGGEEFAILLPNLDRFTCFKLAETIRLAISNTPFTIQNHLEENNKKLNIRITASIGIASAPDDGDDPMALIRHADRALYTGAKQKGRNKVAQYVK